MLVSEAAKFLGLAPYLYLSAPEAIPIQLGAPVLYNILPGSQLISKYPALPVLRPSPQAGSVWIDRARLSPYPASRFPARGPTVQKGR